MGTTSGSLTTSQVRRDGAQLDDFPRLRRCNPPDHSGVHRSVSTAGNRQESGRKVAGNWQREGEDTLASQPPTEGIKRDLQATLGARREIGPEYDEQFIAALAERLTRQVAQERRPPQPAHNALAADQRTALAIVSLIFMIPLVAIASGSGLPGIALVCAAVVLINVAAAKL